MAKETCSKRIIIRPETHLATAIQAAGLFIETHIAGNDTPLPFGLYHAKRYVAEQYTTDGDVIHHIVQVYHTEKSIVVMPGEPTPEPDIKIITEPKELGEE